MTSVNKNKTKKAKFKMSNSKFGISEADVTSICLANLELQIEFAKCKMELAPFLILLSPFAISNCKLPFI